MSPKNRLSEWLVYANITSVMENDKRSETIEKLKKAGKEEFLEYGYQRASLRRICKSAGVTTGAFYFSFESKEALFKAILEPLVNQYENLLGKLMQSEIEDSGTGVEADKAMMQFLLKHKEEAMIIMNGATGSCYEDYHLRVEEFMRHSFAAYYRSRLGCEPDETLVRVLAKMRLEGAMAILNEDVDVEKKMYLTEKIGIHATGGTEKLIQSLQKEVHR